MINTIDNGILDFIQANMRCTFLDWIMPYISLIGDYGAMWILLALILIINEKTRIMGIEMAVALLLGFLIANITLKPLIARVRPFDVNTDVMLLIKAPTDFSFPSGHTVSSFAATGVVWLNDRKYGIAALTLATLIAFSRLYLYVHYPTDVFAAIIIGVVTAILSVGFVKFVRGRVSVTK